MDNKNQLNQNSSQNNFVDAMQYMPTFENFREQQEQLEMDVEDIEKEAETLNNHKENLERRLAWRNALTDLKDSIEKTQPGDQPGKWKEDFLKKGYMIHAVTSDAYNEKSHGGIEIFPLGHQDGEPFFRNKQLIGFENEDYESVSTPQITEQLAQHDVSLKDIAGIYNTMFYDGDSALASQAYGLTTVADKYFGENLSTEYKNIMSSILAKSLFPDHILEYDLDDNEEDLFPEYTSPEIDYLAKIVASEANFNPEIINTEMMKPHKVSNGIAEGDYPYDPLLAGVLEYMSYGGQNNAEMVIEKARGYANNPDAARIEARQEDGDTPSGLATPHQKKFVINRIEIEKPNDIDNDDNNGYAQLVLNERRDTHKKINSSDGDFSYDADWARDSLSFDELYEITGSYYASVDAVEKTGLAIETVFKDGDDVDMPERIDFMLGKLFDSNTFSEAEKSKFPDECVEKYPNINDTLFVSAEIEKILSDMDSKEQLVAEIEQINQEIHQNDENLDSIQTHKEQLAKDYETMEREQGEGTKEIINFLSDYEQLSGINKQELSDWAVGLYEVGDLNKVRERFGDLGVKKLGIIEFGLFENRLGNEGSDSELGLPGSLEEALQKLVKEYCDNDKELTAGQRRIMDIARQKVDSMLTLSLDDLTELFDDKYDNDILANILRSSFGVYPPDSLKQVFRAK